MEVTFYYGGIMPKSIQERIGKETGWELTADFPEDESGKGWGSFGNYFIGDSSDQDFTQEEGYEPKYEQGFFTRDNAIKAIALYDSIVPKNKRHLWSLQGNGGWADGQIIEEKGYLDKLLRRNEIEI